MFVSGSCKTFTEICATYIWWWKRENELRNISPYLFINEASVIATRLETTILNNFLFFRFAVCFAVFCYYLFSGSPLMNFCIHVNPKRLSYFIWIIWKLPRSSLLSFSFKLIYIISLLFRTKRKEIQTRLSFPVYADFIPYFFLFNTVKQ